MDIIVIRGGGDIATGIAHRLFRAGFKVVILDIEYPTAIRRKVSFCEAIYKREITIEGVRAVLCENVEDIYDNLDDGNIAVYVDEDASVIPILSPIALVDSILAKKNLGTSRDMAPITIGVGPGFSAGDDVDLVVETNRGHYLGRVIKEGSAIADTGIPGNIIGYTSERIVRAMGEGVVKNFHQIGDMVKIGDLICTTGGVEVKANIDGVLRGIIKEGLYVKKNMKIGDIDPRGIVEYTSTISDKARSVGGGVLEAIMHMKGLGKWEI